MSYDLDLVVLVPGEDDRETMAALLGERLKSLHLRPLRFEILKHPQRDPGCFHEAPSVLQPFANLAHHALVIFDHKGSGQEDQGARTLEADVERRLSQQGWGDRARCLVLEPELEVWVWSSSPHVASALNWSSSEDLRAWLEAKGLWRKGEPKPHSPKEAVEKACREVRLPRSSAVYRRIASKVGLSRCHDAGFAALRELLTQWFAS